MVLTIPNGIYLVGDHTGHGVAAAAAEYSAVVDAAAVVQHVAVPPQLRGAGLVHVLASLCIPSHAAILACSGSHIVDRLVAAVSEGHTSVSACSFGQDRNRVGLSDLWVEVAAARSREDTCGTTPVPAEVLARDVAGPAVAGTVP